MQFGPPGGLLSVTTWTTAWGVDLDLPRVLHYIKWSDEEGEADQVSPYDGPDVQL